MSKRESEGVREREIRKVKKENDEEKWKMEKEWKYLDRKTYSPTCKWWRNGSMEENTFDGDGGCLKEAKVVKKLDLKGEYEVVLFFKGLDDNEVFIQRNLDWSHIKTGSHIGFLLLFLSLLLPFILQQIGKEKMKD